mgnify:CR=1 FL=1
MKSQDSSEIIAFESARAWESWLAKHHTESSGVWLLIAKKGVDKALITIGEALDVALCYGWIDSQRKGHDDESYLQRYSPRRPKSPWSQLNVERVDALTKAKRMRARGLAEVAAARADGRWDAAYVRQKDATTPPDLAAALKKNARARAAFEKLDKSTQYALYLPLLKATTLVVREARLKKIVATLTAGK